MKIATKKAPLKQVAKKIGTLDSSQAMRKIRDELSKEIMNMTFEEESTYLKKLLAKK
jgi:hypothetical protein